MSIRDVCQASLRTFCILYLLLPMLYVKVRSVNVLLLINRSPISARVVASTILFLFWKSAFFIAEQLGFACEVLVKCEQENDIVVRSKTYNMTAKLRKLFSAYRPSNDYAKITGFSGQEYSKIDYIATITSVEMRSSRSASSRRRHNVSIKWSDRKDNFHVFDKSTIT